MHKAEVEAQAEDPSLHPRKQRGTQLAPEGGVIGNARSLAHARRAQHHPFQQE